MAARTGRRRIRSDYGWILCCSRLYNGLPEASSSLWQAWFVEYARQFAASRVQLLHDTHVASPPSLPLLLQFYPSPQKSTDRHTLFALPSWLTTDRQAHRLSARRWRRCRHTVALEAVRLAMDGRGATLLLQITNVGHVISLVSARPPGLVNGQARCAVHVSRTLVAAKAKQTSLLGTLGRRSRQSVLSSTRMP